MDLPAAWSQHRATTFSTWALKLGIRKTVVGMNVKLIIPRSAISNLRRCVQAVYNITSSEDSSLPSGGSQLPSSSSVTLNQQSSSILNQQSSSILNQQSSSILNQQSSTLNQQSSSTLNQSTLDTSQSRISSRFSTNNPAPPPDPSSRSDELSRQTLPSLRAICKSYGVKVTGRKQELVDRILSIENAIRQGFTTRNASTAQTASVAASPTRSFHASPVQSRVQLSTSDADESLLHQLQREQYQREHREGDFFHDAAGQYRVSIDDESTLMEAPAQTSRVSMSFMMPPPASRLSLLSEHSVNTSETSSLLGDLPRLCVVAGDA